MSQLYNRHYSRDGTKYSRPTFQLVRTRKKNYYPKAFIGSLLVHSLFLLILAVIPENSPPKSSIVTFDHWQKPSDPIVPEIEEVKAPAPVKVAPAPVKVAPAPVKVAPAPVKVAPAPVKVAPAPVKAAPAPVKVAPAPVKVAPAPVKVAPAPVKVAPAPVKVAPAPVDVVEGEGSELPSSVQRSTSDELLSTDASDEAWNFLNDYQNSVEDMGTALLQISGRQRNFTSMPNFDFLESNNFTSRLKTVRIELKIAADGTILGSRIIPPGTGEPILDRELRMALKDAFFNDIAVFGRGTEVAILIINFKD